MDLRATYPGTQGIGVSVPIAPGELAEHERSVRSEGFPGYAIHPAGERDTYHSIIYLEPFDWRNRRAFGYDMSSEVIRRSAMQEAIDTGRPVLSLSVRLVQETDTDIQSGLLFYMPMYSGPMNADASAQARRSAFTGMVYAVLRVEDLMSGVLGPNWEDTGLEIFEPRSDASDQRPLFTLSRAAGELSERRFTEGALPLYGRLWRLRVSTPRLAWWESRRWLSTAIGVAGTLVIGLLGVIVSILSRHRRQFQRKAHSLSAEIVAREIFFSKFLESMDDAMLIVDEAGRVIYANAALCRLFGYDGDELIGEQVERLVPLAHRARHGALRSAYQASSAGDAADYAMNGDREVMARSSQGEEIPVSVALTSVETRGHLLVMATVRDLRPAKARREEIERYTSDLKRSNDDLRRFAHAASHDLKAPLRAMDNLVSWIIKDARDVLPDASKRHLDLLKSRAERLERLLDDLLSYSKATGREMAPERVDLRVLVDEVVQLRCIAPSYRIQNDGAPLHLETHRVPLNQILLNLVGNAVKHHDRPGGQIRVSWRLLEEKLVRFEVADDGPGIAPEYREKVFEMYTTLRARDDHDSSGIGLALVRKLVIQQGGSVWLESVGERGTRCVFTWPVQQARLMADCDDADGRPAITEKEAT
ncbi:MAG: CHASE domain-containing protein [Burkholderiaceae bacterium]